MPIPDNINDRLEVMKALNANMLGPDEKPYFAPEFLAEKILGYEPGTPEYLQAVATMKS